MILFIDTSNNQKSVVRLQISDTKEIIKESSETLGSQALLGLIEEVLKESKTKKEDLTGIKVNTGPGSFTGLRVGVSVANALGFSLNIPVNGKKIETEINY